MAKLLSVIALTLAVGMAACQQKEIVPTPAVQETTPVIVEPAPTPTPVTTPVPVIPPKTTTTSTKTTKTETIKTPRLDSLEKRVKTLEGKVKYYEDVAVKYGLIK